MIAGKTLKEVVEHLNGGSTSFMKIRLFDDNTKKPLNSEKILASDKLDLLEVTTVSVNDLFMTYDIRVRKLKS